MLNSIPKIDRYIFRLTVIPMLCVFALAASLHLLAVIPDNPPGLFPRAPLLELDRSPHPVRDMLLAEPITATNGRVPVPERSGLGITVDRAALARFRA